uniref:Uncharacterized protein n=1 Tax=Panagrolaimus sp. PS1159 TaxID=55785 RepID=A0AC35FMB8_9BILA
MSFPWNSQNLPITLPPNTFDEFPEDLLNSIKNIPSEAYGHGILEYTHTDVQKCITQYFCVFPLSICILIFAYLAIFILTLCVQYFIAASYALLSQIYCIFYQMAYFFSPSRWKVSEKELEDLRRDVLLNRDIANNRFRSLDDEKLQIHKYLRNFGM